MVKWLFFDLGSTLIDETNCEEFRLESLLQQVAQQSREDVVRSLWKFASENKSAYKETIQHYGLKAEPWPTHLEKLYTDSIHVLSELQKKYSLGMIANQNPGTIERLRMLGIDSYFSVIAASGELGVAKPDAAIFLYALEKAGCTAQEAIMIGDRLDNDIEPAAKLGMRTIWIRQGMGSLGNPNLLQKKPDFIVDGLNDLLSLL